MPSRISGLRRRGKRSELDPERSAVLSPMFLLKRCSSVFTTVPPRRRIRVNVLDLWVVIQFRGAKMFKSLYIFILKLPLKNCNKSFFVNYLSWQTQVNFLFFIKLVINYVIHRKYIQPIRMQIIDFLFNLISYWRENNQHFLNFFFYY